MRNNNVVQDSRLILQLDRLRHEIEMRKARRWWSDDFSPRNFAGEYLKIEMAHGTQQKNRWLRQVTTWLGNGLLFLSSMARSAKRPFFVRNFPAKCLSCSPKSSRS